MKGQGKELDDPPGGAAVANNKAFPNKFGNRGGKQHIQISNQSSVTGGLDQIHMSEKDINVRTFIY